MVFEVFASVHCLKNAEKSDQGSPQGPATSMPSSVAFADSKHCLDDYCPLIKVCITQAFNVPSQIRRAVIIVIIVAYICP